MSPTKLIYTPLTLYNTAQGGPLQNAEAREAQMNRLDLWLANNLREGTICWFMLLRKAHANGYHIRRLKSGRKVFVRTGKRAVNGQ